jgi:hypothetical protein
MSARNVLLDVGFEFYRDDYHSRSSRVMEFTPTAIFWPF